MMNGLSEHIIVEKEDLSKDLVNENRCIVIKFEAIKSKNAMSSRHLKLKFEQ